MLPVGGRERPCREAAAMFNIWSDLRYAARSLSRTPGFVTAVMLTLALGIGVNVAIYSLYQQILFRPLPVAEPSRLVNFSDAGPKPDGITFSSQAGNGDTIFSYPMYRDLARDQQPFIGIAAHRIFNASLSTGEQASRDTGLFVSGNYFQLLGLRPAAGRLLGPGDDIEGSQAASVVLSYEYWQNQFGGDERIVGRTLIVNGKQLAVVGVAPRGFHGTTVGTRASVFVPITFEGVDAPFAIPDHENRSFYWVHLFARLRPNVGRAEASVAINSLYKTILNATEAPLLTDADDDELAAFRTKSLALEPGEHGQSTTLLTAPARLRTLLAVSASVLLLCCANIAGLMLVRASARSGEIAVRASMGATRSRLMRQLLVEALLLAVPGMLVSFPVAMLTLRGIESGLFGIPSGAFDARLSVASVLVAAGVALGSAVTFGLFPLRRLIRTDPGKALQAFGVRLTAGKSVTRFRSALATTQVALAMALLAVTSVFAQSLGNIARIDLGLDLDSVVTFSMSPETSGYAPEKSAVLFDRLERELGAIPGVTSAASAMVPLLAGVGITMNSGQTALNYVSPGFFRTLGIDLLTGRDFDDADVNGASSVAIVNERFVEDLDKGLGDSVSIGSVQGEIVGVVGNAKYRDVTGEIGPQLFMPRRQIRTQGGATFYVRSALPPGEVQNAIRETIRRVDPIVPITDLRTMQQQVRENLATERFAARISSAFAVLATVLAGIGLYGVLAYAVAQRSREFGLRIALGAPRSRIRGGILKQIAAMALPGMGLGVVAAWLLGRTAQSLLFGVEAGSPVALGSAAAILVVVTFAAAYLPARRASTTDPMVALRYE